MDGGKRNKKILRAAIICLGIALVLLVPALIRASGMLFVCVMALCGAGVALLVKYFFGDRSEYISGILFLALFVIFSICAAVLSEYFEWLAAMCLLAGVVELFFALKVKSGTLMLPIIAVFLSCSFLFLWLFGFITRSFELTALCFVLSVILPIIGIILGIGAITEEWKREKRSKLGIWLSITAIAFPVLVVGTLIILLSSGALIISLM